MRWLWNHADVGAIALLATGLRILVLLAALSQLSPETHLSLSADVTNYTTAARSIVTGGHEHETAIFSFGPGYPLFLSAVFFIFGVKAAPVLVIQLLLSVASCLMLYSLARYLTGSRGIAAATGLIAALSPTSIELSCVMLSDTLYFFTILAALHLLLRGLDRLNTTLVCLSGLAFGYAALTRSIGQFWPIAYFVIVIAYYCMCRPATMPLAVFRRKLAVCSIAGLVVLLGIVSGWMVRNQIVHGLPTMAFTSAGGPATIAALSLSGADEKNYRDTTNQWVRDYMAAHKLDSLSSEDLFRLLQRKAREVFLADPVRVFKAYLRLSWTNINDITYVHRSIVPRFNPKTIPVEYFIKNHELNHIPLVMSMLGLICLALRRRWYVLAVLGVVYAYYACLVGAFPWQGSRFFMPAQIAWTILTPVAIAESIRWLMSVFRYRKQAATSGLQ